MIVYLNGQYVDHANATVSVDDRGFLFADGVYEVARVYEGRVFQMVPHLERMRHGLRELRIRDDAVAELSAIADLLHRPAWVALGVPGILLLIASFLRKE